MQLEARQHILPGDLLEVKLKRGQMFSVFNEQGHICELKHGMGLIVTHVYDDGRSNAEVHVMVLLKDSIGRVWFYDSDRIESYAVLLKRAP